VAKRDNHYELAFEEFLRSRKYPYVAVDEKRRSLVGGASLKSLDFIVSPVLGGSWLVDVKGRHFPAGKSGKQFWKNWSTRDDLRSLWRWERLFGERFAGLFVFAYQVVGDRAPLPADRLFQFREALYGFIGVRVTDYARSCRPLSAAWDTVTVPSTTFRELAAPVDWFFDQSIDLFAADESSLTWFGDKNFGSQDAQLAEEWRGTLLANARANSV
jgi:hypothetical protein